MKIPAQELRAAVDNDFGLWMDDLINPNTPIWAKIPVPADHVRALIEKYGGSVEETKGVDMDKE